MGIFSAVVDSPIAEVREVTGKLDRWCLFGKSSS